MNKLPTFLNKVIKVCSIFRLLKYYAKVYKKLLMFEQKVSAPVVCLSAYSCYVVRLSLQYIFFSFTVYNLYSRISNDNVVSRHSVVDEMMELTTANGLREKMKVIYAPKLPHKF